MALEMWATMALVGTRIQQLREELDARTPGRAFSRAALAARLRVDVETLRRWEVGLTKPPKKGAIRGRLARELGVSVEDLGLDDSVPDDGPVTAGAQPD